MTLFLDKIMLAVFVCATVTVLLFTYTDSTAVAQRPNTNESNITNTQQASIFTAFAGFGKTPISERPTDSL